MTMTTIGQAAKLCDVSAKMIRYYESIGLIPKAVRGGNGYRHYSESDIHTLRFIHRARELGYPLETIVQLLALWRDRGRSSADVKRIALDHAAALRRKLAALEAMVGAVEHLAAHCRGDHRPDCPIMDDLADHAVSHASNIRPRHRHRSASSDRQSVSA